MPTYYNTNTNTGWGDKFKKLYKQTKKVGTTVVSPFKKAYTTAKNKYTKHQLNKFHRQIASRAKSWLTKRKNRVASLARRGIEGTKGVYEDVKAGTVGKYRDWRTRRANKAQFNAQAKLTDTREDTQFLDKFKITKITHPNKLSPELEIYMLEDGQYTVISKETLHTTIEKEYSAFYDYLAKVNIPRRRNDMKYELFVYFPKSENTLKYDYQVPETIDFVTDLDNAYRVYLRTSKEQSENENQQKTPAEHPATLWEGEFPEITTPTRTGSRTSNQRRPKSLSGSRQSRRSNKKPARTHSV